MPTLLHIDSSPMGDASITRELTRVFVEEWKKANPSGKVITRDLDKSNLKPLDQQWLVANFTPDNERSAEQKQILTVSDTLIEELKTADEIVFGVPMHNFAPPSVFKMWIDLIVRAGITFIAENGNFEGLIKNKKATVVIASGADYSPGSPFASADFVEPYLKVLLGFVGITNVRYVTAGGAMAVRYGKIDRASFMKPKVEEVKSLFAKV